MKRVALKIALVLMGLHLFLGVLLIIVEATHGINDQDASFALALLVYNMNRPTAWLLMWLGMPLGLAGTVLLVIAGVFQWIVIAFVIAAIHLGIKRAMRGKIAD